jgi:hydroxymethylpyrimidine pyrophosphatase-like HAD family hydrolase
LWGYRPRGVTYKLLAVDIDGTLLRHDGSIHPDDSAAIARLKASGVPVTVVTGRLYSGSVEVARSVDLSGPIACVDGCHIVDLRDDTALVYRSLAGEHAAAIRDTLARHNRAASFLFAHDGIVHDAMGEPFIGYVRTWSPNVDVVDRVTEHPFWEHELGLMAVVALGMEDHITAAGDELRERLAHVAAVLSFPVTRVPGLYAMLVRAAGTNKGTAIEWLAEHHGCTARDVVAVGDWLNDLPMFKAAGRSFAMNQAPPSVKDAATDALDADGIDGGGVAEAIRRAFGI